MVVFGLYKYGELAIPINNLYNWFFNILNFGI